MSHVEDVTSFNRALDAARRLALDHARALDLATLRSVADHSDRSTLDIVGVVLKQLGLFRQTSRYRDVGEAADSLAIVPQYGKLMRRWLGDLVDIGILLRHGNEIATTPRFAELRPNLDENPHGNAIGAILIEVLKGRRHILEYVFGPLRPDWFAAYTAAAYDADPVFTYQHRVVATLVEHLAAASAPSRTFRLIELGAGTGGLTAHVLSSLKARVAKYLYTDVTRGFLDEAKERFRLSSTTLSYALYDINKSPKANGCEVGRFDACLAFDVLHCARDLVQTLSWIRELLRPGGVLVNEQLTKNRLGHLIIPGTMPGFTDFADDRLADHRTLPSPSAWRCKLDACGYTDVCILPDDDVLLEEIGQGVIVARNP